MIIVSKLKRRGYDIMISKYFALSHLSIDVAVSTTMTMTVQH